MVRFLPCSSWRFGNDFFEIKERIIRNSEIKRRNVFSKCTVLMNDFWISVAERHKMHYNQQRGFAEGF